MKGTGTTVVVAWGVGVVAGILGLLTITLCPTRLSAADQDAKRHGSVQFSNGSVVEGEIYTAPGAEFKISAGDSLKTLAFDIIAEIRMAPEVEKMEQKWKFVEAGKTEKKKWGEPYPVRHLAAVCALADGSSVTGHLYTTMLYVDDKEGTTKVILRAKDRGKEGESFLDLVYPVSVTFDDAARMVPGTTRIRLDVNGVSDIVGLTRGGLSRLVLRPGTGKDEFVMPSAYGADVFLATLATNGIVAGWPVATNDAGLLKRIEGGLEGVRDFFDSRRICGVWHDAESIYSLLMLERQGKTTLDAEASQPWRLEIWRWKEEDGKLMVAGRGYFFRGIMKKGERPPNVLLSKELWRPCVPPDAERP